MSFSATYPFDPPLLPPKINFREESFIDLLLKARTELAELKGYSSALPNPMILLSPAVLRESVASSKIENINTTVENVLQMQLFPEVEQREPDKEVLHYKEAVLWGSGQLQKISISTRLITGIHQRLLPETKSAYRKVQNTIADVQTGEVFYTPPEAQKIPGLISNWERFLNTEDNIDPLIKCIIAHYQFEAIHPFGDGNGRIGRILMVLYLIQKEVLSYPILYISGYINKNRTEYYRLLNNVSAKEQWNEFIIYLLQGFYLQAKETKTSLMTAMKILHDTKELVKTKNPKIYSSDLIEVLFTNPIVSPVSLGRTLGIHYTTASRYLIALNKIGIITDVVVGKYHLYANKKLLNILKH